MVEELTHPEYGPLKVLGIPIKLSDTPGAIQIPPPKFGEHNREILRNLGFAEADIDGFLQSGVLAQ